MFIFMYPEAGDVDDDLNFTIEPKNYVRVTYSWEYIKGMNPSLLIMLTNLK